MGNTIETQKKELFKLRSKVNDQENEINELKKSHEETNHENKCLKDEIAAHIELSKNIMNAENSKHHNQDNIISVNQNTQTDNSMDNQVNLLQLNSMIQLQSEIKSKDEEIINSKSK